MRTRGKLALMAAVPAAIGVLGIAPAQADRSMFFQILEDQYWAQSFTASQLLQEGYKVCHYSAGNSEMDLAEMVASDLGISDTASISLVFAAKLGLGC